MALFFIYLLFGPQPAFPKPLAGQVAAAMQLSEVRDVVYTPQGSPFTGKITIEPQHFQHLSPPILVIPISDGMLQVTLVSTSPVFPSESYTVTYTGESNTSWTEVWRVPSGNRLSLKDVRVSTANGVPKPRDGGNEPDAPKDISLPVPMVDIAGLSNQLNSIATSLVTITNTANALGSTISSLQSLQIVRNEIPKGAINGSNSIFTLANIPSPNSVSIMLSGIRLRPTLDFSVSGNTVSLVTACTPQLGDIILVDYRFSNSGSSTTALSRTITLPIPISEVAGLSPALNQIATNLSSFNQQLTSLQTALSSIGCQKVTVGETPSGAINGLTTTFTLSDITAVSSTVAVYVNGVRLSLGVDYTLGQASINFLPVAVPQSGDNLTVDYCSKQ